MKANIRFRFPTGDYHTFPLSDASLFGALHELGAAQVELELDQGTGQREYLSVPFRVLVELMILRGVIKYPPKYYEDERR